VIKDWKQDWRRWSGTERICAALFAASVMAGSFVLLLAAS
jgi:hypothetical protein